jgi:F0F1-type ATP synthase delta subunit
VEIIQQADTSIIGGAVISFEDQQIDMSVRGSLRQMATAIGNVVASSRS